MRARGRLVHVKQRDFGAGCGKRSGGCAPIAPAAPVIAAIWPASGTSVRFSELGLFKRPVFDVEHIGFRNRLKTSDSFGISDGFYCGFGEIGSDARILLAAPQAEQSEPGHEYNAGQGIEHPLAAVATRVVVLEVRPIARCEFGDRVLDALPKVVARAVFGRRDHKWPVLGTDRVIGGDDARLAVACDLGAVDEIEDRGVGAKIEHKTPIGASGLASGMAASAAHDRSHLVPSMRRAAAMCAVSNTALRLRRSRASASDTISIMRS